MAELKIDVQDLYRSHGSNEVPKGITTQFHEGSVVCVIGSSGSGESAFLRTLNLFETVTSGKVIVGGRKLSNPKTGVDKVCKDIEMVFQHSNLFPHMTVLKDITSAPIELGEESKEGTEKHAMELLGRTGLANKCNAKPESLSGGRKQRMAVVRNLAMSPDIMFFDEPTSALDPEMIGDVPSVMKNLAGQGVTMLIITHETGFARRVANRVIFTNGDKFLEDGIPEQIFDSPRHPCLKDFLDKVLNV